MAHAPGGIVASADESGEGTPEKRPRRSGGKKREEGERMLQVRIVAPSAEAFIAALGGQEIDFACRGPRVAADGVVVANALMSQETVAKLERSLRGRVKIEVVGDFSANLVERQAEVGEGNRFEDGRTLPQGLGELVREQPQ